ncbi:MAG TPA: UDP-N-acetylmuramoyl-L-alanine--D-glutamate ligase [Frankiaceae bacterium]|nr:UDP-N-acetylmuramoyl-L-alanine--D-glutamate ligase [Frankiaceae bacterium]
MNTRPNLSWSDLRGARVGVWGLGVEGHANLRRLKALGAAPVLVDDAPSEAGALRTDKGGFDALRSCDVVVKTPGISRYRSEIQTLEADGIPVAGGLGLWMQEADRTRVACITGTKGKSTTTSIAGHLLQMLGFRCFIGGNLGSPPWDPDAEQDADFWLIETSSYQATDLKVAPRVVAVTSLHPDHLNWHRDLNTYYRDKLSICTLPGAQVTVSNAEDPVVAEHRAQLGPHVRWVPDPSLPGDWVPRLRLLGHHNAVNALLAQAVLAELGIAEASDAAALAEASEGFVPLASRLQEIGLVDGVTFVDDSLSTNVLPTLAALDAFPDRRVALIAGGFDRGVDYDSLATGVQRRRAPLLVLGVPDNGPRIIEAILAAGSAPFVETRPAESVEEATRLGLEWAAPDGVVLLSPAAPSFGRFRDYRERAAAFTAAMHALRKMTGR